MLYPLSYGGQECSFTLASRWRDSRTRYLPRRGHILLAVSASSELGPHELLDLLLFRGGDGDEDSFEYSVVVRVDGELVLT